MFGRRLCACCRFGAAGSGDGQQAHPDALQSLQQPALAQQQFQQFQTQHQPLTAAQRLADARQPGGSDWMALAAAEPALPGLSFSPGRQHASTRSTSAPQLMRHLPGQHGVAQPQGWLPPAADPGQRPYLGSASELRTGFLHAPPELQQQLMQEAGQLRQQQLQHQQRQQHQRAGKLVGESPQSSPSIGGFGPRLALATARLSDFELNSRANSTNSRFSAAETSTSSGSAAPPHSEAPPPRLATTIGFSNPVGVYPDALSAGQQGGAVAQAAGPQPWQHPNSMGVAASLRQSRGGASPDALLQQPIEATPAADAQAASAQYGTSLLAGSSPQLQQQVIVRASMS